MVVSDNVITAKWDTFSYTGNNFEASKWILNNILSLGEITGSISYGPINNNSTYKLIIGTQSWEKAISLIQ